MDVYIDEVISNVRAVDDSTLLEPRVLQQIIQAVLQAVRDGEEHQARVRAEQHIPGSEDALPGERPY